MQCMLFLLKNSLFTCLISDMIWNYNDENKWTHKENIILPHVYHRIDKKWVVM